MDVEYASKGVGNTALGLSIGALGVELLNGNLNGLLDNLGGRSQGNDAAAAAVLAAAMASGGRSSDSCDHTVNRYEAGQAARIAELETEVKLRDANTYTDQKLLQMYQYVDGRLRGVESQICQQSVINAQVTANLSCMQNELNTLSGMTKTVIPISNVCPEPMARYNSWTAPTSDSTSST